MRLAKEHMCIPHGHKQQCGEGRGVGGGKGGAQGWVEVGKDGGNRGHLLIVLAINNKLK